MLEFTLLQNFTGKEYLYPVMNNIRVHLNVQSCTEHNGFRIYESEITERLAKYDDLEIDAYHIRLRPKQKQAIPSARRVIFPNALVYSSGKKGGMSSLIKSLLRTFIKPFITLNSIIGVKSKNDVHVFFENAIPDLRVRGKVIGVIHDIMTLRIPGYKGSTSQIFEQRIRAMIDRCDMIVTVSEFSKQDIVDYFKADPEKIAVINGGIITTEFEAPIDDERVNRLRGKYNLPDKYILHFGSCLLQKNVEGLVKAYSLLPENLRSEYKLLITNPSEEVRQCVRDNNMSSHVLFLNNIPDEDRAGIYKLASVFVWPSFYEGFGVPPLEAMAAGVPVVASNAASMPEILCDAAYYVSPHDTQEIAHATYIVLTDENLRRELTAKGYENLKRFSFDESARMWHDIILSL